MSGKSRKPQAASRIESGLTEELVRKISADKKEPEWMLEKRLRAFALFKEKQLPKWGPDLSKLDLGAIVYYSSAGTEEKSSWEDLPEDIRRTFDRLGIPEAERKALSGAGAQYDSDVVYHNLKKEWDDLGVVFENMDAAVRKYPELVRKHFMTECVPIHDHKFAMLHAAVWSGGTFIYVPPGVKVDVPLQAYFRMNAVGAGQFEHTLIIIDEGAEAQYIEGCSAPRYNASSIHAGCVEIFVRRGAKLRYSSVENWSKNTWNLNTKRALVDAEGTIEWVGGNFGAGVTMLYPCSILRGEGAKADNLGIAFAGPGQDLDVGAKVIHAAPRTSSTVRSKSLSKGGGVSTFRGLVRVVPAAAEAKCSVACDALMLDGESVSNTRPTMKIESADAEVVHEATVGRIGEDELFYLMSRGLTEEEARRTVVNGFVEPIVRSLPLEYAIEMNKLIEMEMENAIA